MGLARIIYVRDCCEEVTGVDRLVLYALASRCGDDWQCKVGRPQLLRDTGLSSATLTRVIGRLVAAGYLTTDPPLRVGRMGVPYAYRFVHAAPVIHQSDEYNGKLIHHSDFSIHQSDETKLKERVNGHTRETSGRKNIEVPDSFAEVERQRAARQRSRKRGS